MISDTIRDDFKSALLNCKRALIVFPSFPFFVVGRVEKIRSSYVVIKSEFGVPQELKGLFFRIRFDAIQAYFVETDQHKIPEFEHEDDKDECEEE